MMYTLTPKSYSYTVRLLLHSLLVALFIGTTFADVEKKRLGSLRKDDLVVTDVTGGGGGGISKDEVIAIVTNNDTKVVMPREIDVAHKEARSMKPTRIGPYLWFMTSDGEDFAQATNRMSQAYPDYRPYGCSGICNSRYHGRNLDWYYNKQASVVVRAPAKDGKHGVLGIVCGAIDDAVLDKGEWDNRYASLPFCLGDGINDAGVTIQQNVVPRDPTKSSPWRSSSKGKIISFCIIRYVLDRCSTAREAADMICNLVYIPSDFAYDSHYMVSDATSSFIVEDGVVYESYDAPTDALTNFRIGTAVFNEDNTVNWATVEPYGQGLERYDLMRTSPYNLNTEDGIKSMMKDLWYTRAYETNTVPYWYTEHCDASTPELTVMAAKTNQALFAAQKISWKQDLDREHDKTNPDYRGGKTWQTVHTTIYDRDNLTMRLITQEDPTSERLFNLITDVPTSHDLTDVVTRETDSTGHATAVTVGSRCNVSGLKEWSNTNTYYQGDTVKHDGVAYVCTVDPQSFVPPTDHWTNQAPFWTAAAVGPSSFANGLTNVSSGIAAHAEGISTHAGNKAAHSDGLFTAASGLGAHASGNSTLSCGSFTSAEGTFSIARGMGTHAEGGNTKAAGISTHAEGRMSVADGLATHAEGNATKADGIATHASGSFTTAGIRDMYAHGTNSAQYGTAAYAAGWGSVSTSQTSFTWQGVGGSRDVLTQPTTDELYGDHGAGTFNINPINGTQGLFIGNTNLYTHVTTIIREDVAPWAMRGQPHPTGTIVDVRTNGMSVVVDAVANIDLSSYETINGAKAKADKACSDAIEAAARRSIPWTEDKQGNNTSITIGSRFDSSYTACGVGSVANGSAISASGAYSHSEGEYSTAMGDYSHAEGYNTRAYGVYAHAEGRGTSANGYSAHTEGSNTLAFVFAHAEGIGSTAGGDGSHAEGAYTYTDGTCAHSEGSNTAARGNYSHAEGASTTASGEAAHAEGSDTTAKGKAAHAEGLHSIANGHGSHSDGYHTVASGAVSKVSGVYSTVTSDYAYAWQGVTNVEVTSVYYDHGVGTFNISPVGGISGVWVGDTNMAGYIEAGGIVARDAAIADAVGKYVPFVVDSDGGRTAVTIGSRITGTRIGKRSFTSGFAHIADGENSHAEGHQTTANGEGAHAEGYITTASRNYSHAEGANTTASGEGAHAEGSDTTAKETAAHAEGVGATASGEGAHAEGSDTTAKGTTAHAEGVGSTASGDGSHAEGELSDTCGGCSHAEGYMTVTSNDYSHAEGLNTCTYGKGAHAEGDTTYAEGNTAHAEGRMTHAVGSASHAEGYRTATSNTYAHAEGSSTTAKGAAAHAEGYNTWADANFSHAEGNATRVISGEGGHAEGSETEVGTFVSSLAHDDRDRCGRYAHAEGISTSALGEGAHAEGYYTRAGNESTEYGLHRILGDYSHAEGMNTWTYGEGAHAEGSRTYANGRGSHAEGYGTCTGARSYDNIGLLFGAGAYSHASGWNAWASNRFCFVWQGCDSDGEPLPYVEDAYIDHGNGTFNINPVNGMDGFYIGEETIPDYMDKHYLALDGGGAVTGNIRVVDWDIGMWTELSWYGITYSNLNSHGTIYLPDIPTNNPGVPTFALESQLPIAASNAFGRIVTTNFSEYYVAPGSIIDRLNKLESANALLETALGGNN